MSVTPKKKKGKTSLKNKAEWSVQELQMYVAAALDMHDDDWIPDEGQWETIKDIIFKLKAQPTIKRAPPVTAAAPGWNPAMQMQFPPAGYIGAPPEPNGLLPPADPLPPEAILDIEELNRRHAAGTLGTAGRPIGNGGPGEKTMQTNQFD